MRPSLLPVGRVSPDRIPGTPEPLPTVADGRGRSADDRPGPAPAGRLLRFARETALSLEALADEELVRRAQGDPAAAAEPLDVLFRRYHARVAAWCLRVSGRREEAGDLAQEVFLRVHERLDQFRFESAFVTWIYLVTRSVAINRSISNRRRDADSIDEEGFLEPADPAPGVDEIVADAERRRALREAMREVLDPLEAKILHLHFVDEMPLAGIDRLLELDNKSGARAFLASAKRKLKRHFGTAATTAGGETS